MNRMLQNLASDSTSRVEPLLVQEVTGGGQVLLQVKAPKLKFNGLYSTDSSGEYVLRWHF